jgi:predicted nuclease with TOPRIM domain
MFRFVKWTAIGVLATGALGYLVFGENVVSYFTTMAGSVRDSVRSQVPVEFELKRAEALIRDIDPQISTCKRELAQAEVGLENLVTDVERLERENARAEQKLKAGAAWLAGDGSGEFRLAGNPQPRHRVEIDLDRTFQHFKNSQELVRGKKALIQHQSRAVAAARERLDAVRAEKSRLEDTIATLKSQKVQLDALAATSKRFDLDDSALSRAKQVLAEVKNRLDVAQKMIEDEMFFAAPEPDAEHARDVAAEIRKFFDADAAPQAKTELVEVK